MLPILLAYAAVGAAAGVLAGLFGIGGGLVIVPMLVIIFPLLHLPAHLVMHLALATSMASIIFTSISSFLAHNRRGAVDWSVFWRLTPGILAGSFAGSLVASFLPTAFLKGFFALFLYYVAYRMLLGGKPAASRQLPATPGMFAAGGGIGAVSSWVGIGGGTLTVPFLLWCNVGAHTAVGTAAAIGLPIALAATAGYVAGGLRAADLPAWSVGFVYLPALAGIVATSVSTAPLGVRLAHALPVDKLKRGFAILLVIVASRMAWSLFA
jgi:hypothetical protein